MKKILALLLAVCWQLSTLNSQLSTCSAQTADDDSIADLQTIIAIAEQGDCDAQAHLGLLYAFGEQGAPQDYTQAAHWFTLAAKQGHPTAQYNLAVLYVNGQGVERDTLQAQKWYDLAIAQDSTFEPIIVERPAPSDFTFSDSNGKRGDKISKRDKVQFEKAYQRYHPRAEAGDRIAQYNLGVLYQEGLGTPRNYKEAHKWFTLAAQQGDPNAQNNLGIMYYEGQGVGKNYSLAFHWYTLAAEQGHYAAQYNLGIMYEQGIGTEKNRAKAKQWFLRSAEKGYEPAKQRLQNL